MKTNTTKKTEEKKLSNIETNTYLVTYTCSNCGNHGNKNLPKGYEVVHGITCDYCGCKTTNASKPVINCYPFTINL